MTAAEITAAGYDDIDIGADCASWGFIELQTAASVKIIRIATSDSRVTQSTLDSKHVVYTIELTGTDTDLSGILPVTVGKVAFKKVDSDSADIMGINTFEEGTATISASNDSVTVTAAVGVLA